MTAKTSEAINRVNEKLLALSRARVEETKEEFHVAFKAVACEHPELVREINKLNGSR